MFAMSGGSRAHSRYRLENDENWRILTANTLDSALELTSVDPGILET